MSAPAGSMFRLTAGPPAARWPRERAAGSLPNQEVAMDNEFVERARASRGRWAPELAGRTAIVTGAGRLRSIGRSVALELARQGVNLVLTGTGRSPDAYPPEEKEI